MDYLTGRLRQRLACAALFSASALSVFSQENVSPVRPKWPNAAVFL